MIKKQVTVQRLQAMAERLRIAVIGSGAGPHCDGQILIWHDLLGLSQDFQPRHARRYAHLSETIREALQAYAADVRSHAFPTAEQTHTLKEAELSAFTALVHPMVDENTIGNAEPAP